MSGAILFYVSGHGYGHARRSAQIVKALRRRDTEVRVIVRTAAPASIFTSAGIASQDVGRTSIDAGVVEVDTLTIDVRATVDRVLEIMGDAERIVAAEVETARLLKPSLIVTDIPWLAGDVAERLEVPCVATGNFTWDFIYEPMLAQRGDRAERVALIRASYGKMAGMLREPFAHQMAQFKRVVDVPLVTSKARLNREEAWRQIGGKTDGRKRVLIGMRGGTSGEVAAVAARAAPEFLFTSLQEVPGDGPENLRQVHGAGMDFTDVLAAHDAIVTKLGYGIVCECIANGVRVLWPPRIGFAEDPLFLLLAPRLVPMRQIAREDYLAGRWGDGLRALMAAAPAVEIAPLDGAEVCAEWLLGGKF